MLSIQFLGFFKMSIMFLLISSIIGLIVVMPIQSRFDPDSGWGDFNLAVVDIEKEPEKQPDTSYLWAYLVFTYVFTALLSFFLIQQSRVVSKQRQEYLGHQSSVADRTIKLSGIPHDLRDERKLQEFIDRLRIGDVSAVTICRDWSEIDQLAEQRAATLRKLEEAYVVFEGRKLERNLQTLLVVQPTPEQPDRPASTMSGESQPLINGHRKAMARRPVIRTGLWGLIGKEVDAIDFYTTKLQRLDETILEARKEEYPATSMAFVTFDKVSGAVSGSMLYLLIIATRRTICLGPDSSSTSSPFSSCSQ
jgi:calcium permeable stress-gated cation channel